MFQFAPILHDNVACVKQAIGEVIPYNRSHGVFHRIHPTNPTDVRNRSWGGWEVATRISYINLNELTELPTVAGPGCRLTNTSLGLNWYLLTNAKMQFDYIHTELNSKTFGDSITHTVASQFQYDF